MSSVGITSHRPHSPETRRSPRPPRPSRPPVRLTRRGRVVLTLLLLALALALFTVFSGYSAASGEAGTQRPTTTIVVDEGDTLWGIASELAEPGETREVVHQIQRLNSMSSPALVEGQQLAIPAG